LIGHDFQLGFENQILQASNKDDSQGKRCDPDGGIGGTTGRSILGAFLFLCSVAIMKIAFDLLDAPNNPFGLRGTGAVAGLLIGQGMILILTGNWLP
jgi:hypothetical protein